MKKAKIISSAHTITLILLMAVSLIEMMAMIHINAVHSNDFHHMWGGAFLLANDLDPYTPGNLFKLAISKNMDSINPYVYLPSTGLILRPLAWFNQWQTAQWAWFWFNWTVVWASVVAGPFWIKVSRPRLAQLAGAIFLVGSMPWLRQQTAGQMNALTTALLVWALGAYIRKRDTQLGVALALGFAWKISPVLLILALLPLRRWRAAAIGAATAIATQLVTLTINGWEIHRHAFSMISRMRFGNSTWSFCGHDFYRNPFNQSINSLMHHLLTENPYSTPWFKATPELANRLTLITALALGATWFAIAVKRKWMTKPERPESGAWLFTAAIPLMLLAPSLMWDHYAVQLLPPLIFIFGSAETWRRPWRLTTALVFLVSLMWPLVYTADDLNHGAGLLLMSFRLWGVLGLLAFTLIEPRQPGEVQV